VPAFLVAFAVSLVLLFSPSAPSTGPFEGSDKVVHVLIFATLAALGRRAGFRLLPLAGGLLVYAVASELLQGLLPHRSSSAMDALADLIGTGVGIVLAPVLFRRLRRS
jgi:VanZ family protein